MQQDNGTFPSLLRLMSLAGFEQDAAAFLETITNANQAISEQDKDTLYAITAELDGMFKREIPNALAVQLGITFSDGD